jgi:aldehyde:ferredoxin oxidoreductase
MGMVHNHGQLPHNNMRDTSHEDKMVDRVSGEALRYYDEIKGDGDYSISAQKGTCFNCPVACKRQTTIYDEKGDVFDSGEGPEFESVTLLGANMSIYDLPLIARANYAANRFGMDTISLGGTISAFIDLYELCKSKGNLSEKEKQFMTDVASYVKEIGEPTFGNGGILLPTIDLIAKREGIGDYLAEGSYRFCERYGHAELSMTVKKQELPAYDPRTSYSQALSYEMCNRGGCHLEGGYMAAQAYAAGYGEWDGGRIEGTPLVLKNAAFRNTVFDTIGSCVYTSFSIPMDDYAKLLNAITGMELNAGKLQKIGHRVYTLERLFNVMCGLTAGDDWLPERFYTMPATVEGREVICDRASFEKMHLEYYGAMGWGPDGVPTPDTLEKLEIDGLVGVKPEAGAVR